MYVAQAWEWFYIFKTTFRAKQSQCVSSRVYIGVCIHKRNRIFMTWTLPHLNNKYKNARQVFYFYFSVNVQIWSEKHNLVY